MNRIISRLSVILLVSTLLCGCTPVPQDDEVSLAADAALVKCEDMGEEYIDSFIFIGESTTAHLKSRGVLKDGQNTRQVWTTKGGTMMLDTTTTSVKIVYPDTNEELTVGEAARRKKPQRVLLTFGLNGAVGKIKRGEAHFKDCYSALINAIHSASPTTEIILQSCPPIAKTMDTSAYGTDASTLNGYINTINSWTLSLATELELGYLNSTEVMKDTDGFLKPQYDAGDGYHLSTEAYLAMLEYMRTHGKRERE